MPLSVFAAARDAPDRAALVVDGRAVPYGELADRCRRALAWLRARDLDEAPLLALEADQTQPALEMLHALIALGLPVLLLHPRLTRGEQAALLDRAGGPVTVDPRWDEDHSADADAAGPDPSPPADDARTLAVVATSGTTGRARAALLSRRAFVASATASAANLGWRDDDRWLLPLPVAHVGGLSIVTRCLLARRAVVLPGTGEDVGPESLLATLARDRVTLVSLVPTLLARLLDLDPGAPPPPHLRAILLGGAPAAPSLLERAADRGWPVLTTYGLTEACSQVTTQPYGTVNRGELGAGRPLPGTEVRVAEDGQILVRGPVLLSGYLPPDELSPFRPDGWFPTGDRGRFDDRGNLHVAGRRADRIITGGENVDPVEVERVLERVPGVRQACVFGVPDPEWGEVVCAAIVADGEPDLARLRAGLEAALAPFKRPRRVALLAAIPAGGGGKADRAATARAAAGRLRPL